MPSKWRLLDTGAMDAPYNMALERVLLNAAARGTSPETLHLLEFLPCVLLGYSQSLSDEVNEEYCLQHGIEINRRLSGGGCIYMDGGTLGWEIAAKKDNPGIPGNPGAIYRKLCGGLILALSRFGITASFRSPNDVEVGGRKISGSGGTDLSDSFIFHGSVLVDFRADIMAKALKPPLKKLKEKQISDFKNRTICLRELLGYTPPMTEVKNHIVEAFTKILDIEFEAGGLSREETDELNAVLPMFRSDDWIVGKGISARG